ncbi:MAG: LysM peptidoglycan-binding domain-containing protein [Victivallaceae bacterium]
MNRRDTIIVAVTVNVGLLLVLLITAVRSEHKSRSSKEDLKSREQIVDLDSITVSSEESQALIKRFIEPEVSPLVASGKLSSVAISSNENKQSVTVQDERLTVLEKKNDVSGVSNKTSFSDEKDYIEIVVKKGDFLERIARANHTTVSEIVKVNRLPSTQLKIGQVLKVPVASESDAGLRDRIIKQSLSDNEYYVVKEGDSPWTIALRHKMKLDDLLKLNDLDEYKARYLKPGDQLRVR